MNVSLIEVPLPLNDDAAIEQNEQFLCFFTSTAGVRGDVVTLTVIDNDLSKCALQKEKMQLMGNVYIII